MRRARMAARATTTLALAALVLAAHPPPDTLSVLGTLLPPFVSAHFDDLVKAASASCEAVPQELLFSRTRSLEPPATQMVKFSRSGRRALSLAAARDHLRRSEALVLYVPGWWNTPDDPSSQAIVNALMTKHSSVYLLDTQLSFCRGYLTAVSNILPLSHLLFVFIKKLHKSGYPVSAIHLIGFSLGAHVAGFTGKLVRQKLNTTLGRITALDPARPCFARPEHRLAREDAQFVQVIHSSSGVLGIEEPLGHADVYVNGVRGKQPECQDRRISLECDHAQAWKLYSASAVNEKSLMGRRCSSWKELLHNECSGNETVLGYSCSTSEHGMFLYKSKHKHKQPAIATPVPRLQVVNPFNLLRWPFRTADSDNVLKQ